MLNNKGGRPRRLTLAQALEGPIINKRKGEGFGEGQINPDGLQDLKRFGLKKFGGLARELSTRLSPPETSLE